MLQSDIDKIKCKLYYDDGYLYSWKTGNKVGKEGRAYLRYTYPPTMNEYYIHRLIWAFHNGPIPTNKVIDHIDNNQRNNKIANLQCISQYENCTKDKDIKGEKYIAYNCGTFLVQVRVNGVRRRKRCTTIEDARVYRSIFIEEK